MILSKAELKNLIIDIVQENYGEATFERQPLMLIVEEKIREKGAWTHEDDQPSKGARRKSDGFGQIDWAISELKKTGRLKSDTRNCWSLGDNYDKEDSDICGIILKVTFGDITEIYQDRYIEDLKEKANIGSSWNTKIGYSALEGYGKKILLYDTILRGITVEFGVARVQLTNKEPDFPWSNFITAGSVKEYDQPVPIGMVTQIPGLENFKGRPSVINLTKEQYYQLCGYKYFSQATTEGVYTQGQDFFRQRNSAIMNRRKAIDGYTCQVCGFYLKHGDSFIIDCHHKMPLSQGERGTLMDDLISLCPTCHRIAHIDCNTPLSAEQIKGIRDKISYKKLTS